MPKPEPDKIPIASASDLRHERDALQAVLALNETEDTWEKINRALKRFQAVVRGGATKYTDDCVALLRDPRTAKGLVRSIVSERGALSGTALELVASCTRLGPHFAPLLPVYLPPILRLFGRPNKVYTTRSATTVASIVKNTRLADVLRYLVLEWRAEAGKSASFREHAAATVAAMLGTDTGVLAVDKDALERRIDDLEWVIKTGATGREPSVRSDMKKCWLVYKREWPERVHAFTAPMSPTTRKYLKVDSLSSSAPASHHHAPGPPAVRRAAAHPPHPPPASASAPAVSSSTAGSSSRPAPPLSRSLGMSTAASAASSSSRVLHPASHAALPPPVPALSSTGAALGMGPPPLRSSTRAAEAVKPSHVRTVSSSTASSSRSASRTEARAEPVGSATTAGGESVTQRQQQQPDSVSALKSSTGRTGFKPTAAHTAAATVPMTRPTSSTSSSNRPAGRALMTSSTTSGASAGISATPAATSGTAAEPRKARRIAVVPPATTTTATTTTSTTTGTTTTSTVTAAVVSAPVLTRSHSSSTSSSSLARSQAAAAGVTPVPLTSAAPSSTLAPATAVAALGPSHAPFRPTRRPQGVIAANSTTTTTSAAARARPGVAPSAATLASRERRAARERERERKTAEGAATAVAAASLAAQRRRGHDGAHDGGGDQQDSGEALRRRRREREAELREVARRVPLPPPGPEEEGEEPVASNGGGPGSEPTAAVAGVFEELPPTARSLLATASQEAPSAFAGTATCADGAPVDASLTAAEASVARAPPPRGVSDSESRPRPGSVIEVPPEQEPEVEEQLLSGREAPAAAATSEQRPVDVARLAEAVPAVATTAAAAAAAAAEQVPGGASASSSPSSTGVVDGQGALPGRMTRENDDDHVEESVGMDSDYLVESQGTEGGGDFEPAPAPVQPIEEVQVCPPAERLLLSSSVSSALASPSPSPPSSPVLAQTGHLATARGADIDDDIDEDNDDVSADVSDDTTMAASRPFDVVSDSLPPSDGPDDAEQAVSDTRADPGSSMAGEDEVDEHVELGAPTWDQQPAELTSRLYGELPPSPLLSRSTLAPAVATETDAPVGAPSPSHPTLALATPTRVATPPARAGAATYHPSPSPGPVSRLDAPFTPVSRVVPVRFPVATMMPYSPEPFQTRSIILDTPPRFEQYAPVRLPQRAVPTSETPFGEQPVREDSADEADRSLPSAVDDPLEKASSLAAHRSEVQDDVDASPQSAPGAIPAAMMENAASEPTLPQGRFFADAAEVDDDADADTTYEDDDHDPGMAVQSDAGERDRRVDTDEEERELLEKMVDEVSEVDVIPSGDIGQSPPSVTSSYDDSAIEPATSDPFRGQEEAEEVEEAADLTVHEESSALTELASSPAAAPVAAAGGSDIGRGAAQAEEDTGEDEDEDEDEDGAAYGAPASPAGTTLDFSDFNAPPSTSTPSARERRPFWDESLLGDESANFELEQPGLRFHDETESEHSMASTLLGDFDISGRGPASGLSEYRRVEPEAPAATEAAPTVLQRSLRSRVVTVDLAASTNKTPARSTRAATAGERRDALTELQQ